VIRVGLVVEPVAKIQTAQVRELMDLLGKFGQAELSEIEESSLPLGFFGDQQPGNRETFGIGHGAFSG